MKNKFIKIMTAFVAISSCVLVVSCKDKKSKSVDNSYKIGSNKTISKVLDELSEQNDEYEVINNVAKTSTQYSNTKNINSFYFELDNESNKYIYRYTDNTKVCDVTNVLNYGNINDYSVYTRVDSGSKYTEGTSSYTILKNTIYGHIVNDDEKYDFELTYYSCSYGETYYYSPTISFNKYEITISDGNGYVSTTTNLSKKENEIKITPTKTNHVVTGDIEEDIDYEKVYKYNGYTYVEEMNQYVKYVESGDYLILYHKDEKGKDLTSVSINENAYFNGSTFIWQEDTIIAEKNEESDFTYYDASGNKHLLKTYCTTLDGKKDATEIKTKFKFASQVAESENYLVLTGYEIDGNKLLDNKARTYFLNNSSDILYKTLINEDYSKVVKVNDDVYSINNKLFDSKLNYIDSAAYTSYQNAFISSTAIYDLNGNVITTGSYTTKRYAIYDNINDKCFGLVNNNLVEYSGKYFEANTFYNLDIIVTKSGDNYRYDVKSLAGNISTTFYSSNENLTFNFTRCDTSLKLYANSTLYSDSELTTSLNFVLFTF